MNNKQVAQAWATQSQTSGRGSRLVFDGRKLYSEQHGKGAEQTFVHTRLLAELSADGLVARFNPARLGRTPEKHKALAREACRLAGVATFDWSSSPLDFKPRKRFRIDTGKESRVAEVAEVRQLDTPHGTLLVTFK